VTNLGRDSTTGISKPAYPGGKKEEKRGAETTEEERGGAKKKAPLRG